MQFSAVASFFVPMAFVTCVIQNPLGLVRTTFPMTPSLCLHTVFHIPTGLLGMSVSTWILVKFSLLIDCPKARLQLPVFPDSWTLSLEEKTPIRMNCCNWLRVWTMEDKAPESSQGRQWFNRACRDAGGWPQWQGRPALPQGCSCSSHVGKN
jgi:hypothetical protein